MKTIKIPAAVILLSFYLLTNTSLKAQCHFDLLIINTQSEIDSFIINNPDCNKLSGTILIQGDDILNLSGLGILTQ